MGVNPARRVVRGIRYVPYLLRRTVVKGWNDRVLGLSAEAAFWQLLSLPSLFLALVATLGYVSRWLNFDLSKVESTIERTLAKAFSQEVTQDLIHPTLHEVLFGQRPDVISIGFVLALWAGSSATATFVNTVTIAYDMRDQRGPVRSRLLALWVFLGTVALGVVVLPLLVLGPDLLKQSFPHRFRHQVGTIVDTGYYPVLVVLLLVGLTTFYHVAVPRRLPWSRGLPGALLAILIFLAGSAGLRTYISFLLQHNHAYTALAAPIAALLFFFVLALGVLLGAEFNAAVEQLRPAKIKPPRVLATRNWHRLGDEPKPDVPDDGADEAQPESPS